MMNLKRALKATPLYRALDAFRSRRALAAWIRGGRSGPPPAIYKRELLRDRGVRHKLDILVETGTSLGDTVHASLKHFKRIYSIELSEDLYRKAVDRFRSQPSVRLLNGDSGALMPAVLKELNEPALFWLDGHYSAGFTAKADTNTPILAELEAIFAHPVKGHVILVDDARIFDGTDDYPTIEELRAFVKQRKPDSAFSVEDDIIRIDDR